MADLVLDIFPRDVAPLADAATLTKFLDEAVRRGYIVLPADNALTIIAQLQDAGALKPGMRAEVDTGLAAYRQGSSDTFECYLRFTAPTDQDFGLLFGLTLFRGDSIRISLNDNTFKYNEFGLRNYERFLEFVGLVYQTWPPLYGAMSNGPEWEQDQVRALAADTLFELTLFGPEYVAKLGRDKFEAIQVWRKTRMADGGYLIAVGLYARYTQPNLNIHPLEVAQTLGLDAPDFMD